MDVSRARIAFVKPGKKAVVLTKTKGVGSLERAFPVRSDKKSHI